MADKGLLFRTMVMPLLKSKEDWIPWARRMKAALREEGLLNTINILEKDKITSQQKNRTVSYILRCIDNDQMNHFDEDEEDPYVI